jgi:hypothetical protein
MLEKQNHEYFQYLKKMLDMFEDMQEIVMLDQTK